MYIILYIYIYIYLCVYVHYTIYRYVCVLDFRGLILGNLGSQSSHPAGKNPAV